MLPAYPKCSICTGAGLYLHKMLQKYTEGTTSAEY
jgi:hypothetical protein